MAKDLERKLQCDREWSVTRYVQRLRNAVCVLCGAPARSGKAMCQTCQDKQTIRSKTRRTQQKIKVIEYLGGQCRDCELRTDIIDVYDFHHLNPLEKDEPIARIVGKSWERVKWELDKCVLLCANCHRMRHAQEE